jgi:hypothetical protein
MVFSSNSLTIHDDPLHTGSAKRNSASGVKGIDAGQLLTPKAVMADIDAAIINAANGIAGLDASAKFAGLFSTSASLTYIAGSYAGDNTQNRARAHGMSIFVAALLWTGAGDSEYFHIVGNALQASSAAGYAVTAPDGTNFYVGSGAPFHGNANTATYRYLILGVP